DRIFDAGNDFHGATAGTYFPQGSRTDLCK
ncbi:MAG: hypothetical protein ACI8P9_000653, partial [Parasphingorhabdus sp.]